MVLADQMVETKVLGVEWNASKNGYLKPIGGWTNFESTSPDKVLDGQIDDFLEHSLYQVK